jgi:two-component system chemotaxis response regulator CheY
MTSSKEIRLAHALVVDDSRAVRKLLAQTLGDLGYETSEAENGKTALAVLQACTTPPELILTDWNMPEMNGLDLLKAVRNKPEYHSVPIVMVTTETEMEHMAAALEAGANEYVMKPFTRDILADKLRLAGIRV